MQLENCDVSSTGHPARRSGNFRNFSDRPGVNLSPAQILRMRTLARNLIDLGALVSRGERSGIMATLFSGYRFFIAFFIAPSGQRG